MLWWQYFPQAFNQPECQAIIDRAAEMPAKTGTIGHGGVSTVNEAMRKSTVRWLARDDMQLSWFYARVERMALQANVNGFGFDLTGTAGGFYEIQFTEYHAENCGHYDWHEDNTWKIQRPFDRKMSMVMQLTPPDQYDGGRLELTNDPLPQDAFRQQGDVIFFPSFNRHRVTPLTRGVRYSIVTWFYGPQFR